MIRTKTKYIELLNNGSTKIKLLRTTHLDCGVKEALIAIVAKVGILNLQVIHVLDDDKQISILSPIEVVNRTGLKLPKELLRMLSKSRA